MIQIVTVCTTVEISSVLHALKLVQQLNSPQTDIHVREFKYTSCGQIYPTFTMEIISMSQHCYLPSTTWYSSWPQIFLTHPPLYGSEHLLFVKTSNLYPSPWLPWCDQNNHILLNNFSLFFSQNAQHIPLQLKCWMHTGIPIWYNFSLWYTVKTAVGFQFRRWILRSSHYNFYFIQTLGSYLQTKKSMWWRILPVHEVHQFHLKSQGPKLNLSGDYQ